MPPVAENAKTFAKAFGKSVRKYRKACGMKQEDLGQSSGYDDHSIISKIETGKSLPSLEQAFVLARVLHKPLESFVTDDLPEDQLLSHLAMLALQWPVAYRDDFVIFLRALAEILDTRRGKPSQR